MDLVDEADGFPVFCEPQFQRNQGIELAQRLIDESAAGHIGGQQCRRSGRWLRLRDAVCIARVALELAGPDIANVADRRTHHMETARRR